jgi:queuine tRNA-ribosyltransferase
MNQHTFSLLKTDKKARRGTVDTAHGSFDTPNFMPVGTKASVKGVDCERLAEVGTQITLVNTYHLWLRPGSELIERLGGIHRFCNWNGPMLSDSGGYQVFSLQGIRKITEQGVEFRSHLDGKKMLLTPELSIAVQEQLGVDIAMAFDECPAADMPIPQLKESLQRTHRWEQRCLEAKSKPSTALFGITQGAGHRDLRSWSAEVLSALPFDGMAIGGLSVGEPKEVMYDVLSYHVDQLPTSKVRYLMGVGTPEDLVQGVYEGVDLFDCVMPTRAGRFGRAFVNGKEPYINIKNQKFREDQEPLDVTCSCVACRRYTKAYLHHLFRVEEMLGPQLLSIHNLRHYLSLMEGIRVAIDEGRFEQLYLAQKTRWVSMQKSEG